jgi:tryptophan halogenase
LILLVIGGLGAFFALGQLEDPEFTIKNATVSTLYPGASAAEVEQEVTDRIEIAIQEMPQIEKLESVSKLGFSLIKIDGIQRLLAQFPDRPISPLERDEYNRGMQELYEDVRDFIVLHYKATQRDDTPFWRYVRDMSIPETLERKIGLWKLHGRVFREGAELFGTTSWVAVMLGQNVWPGRYDPIADTLDEAKVAQAMAEMRERYLAAASALPGQEEFLRAAGAWSAEDVRPRAPAAS